MPYPLIAFRTSCGATDRADKSRLVPKDDAELCAISLDRAHIGAQQQQAGAKPNEID